VKTLIYMPKTKSSSHPHDNHRRLIWRTLAVHTFCWLLFISYELGMVLLIGQKLSSPVNYLLQYAVNITLFYCQTKLLDWALDGPERPYLKSIAYFILLLAGFIFVKVCIDYALAPEGLNSEQRLGYATRFLKADLVRGIYFCILAIFYWLGGNIQNFRRKAAESEKQQLSILKDKAELEARLSATRNAYLQQQLNPHLLFNSLNFIYNSVYRHSTEASRCVLLLSDIMRYSLEATAEDGKALLQEEIQQLNNLIEINRSRFDQPLSLDFRITGDPGGHRIIPLILMTLTENLFKHGRLNEPAFPACLIMDIQPDGQLSYSCHNFIRSRPGYQRKSRLGLQNTRLRLDYSYPDAYRLDISETDDLFQLHLKIQL
jgi:two-component system LytT family sensor kinase